MTGYYIPTRKEELIRAIVRLTGLEPADRRKDKLIDEYMSIMDNKKDHVELFYKKYAL